MAATDFPLRISSELRFWHIGIRTIVSKCVNKYSYIYNSFGLGGAVSVARMILSGRSCNRQGQEKKKKNKDARERLQAWPELHGSRRTSGLLRRGMQDAAGWGQEEGEAAELQQARRETVAVFTVMLISCENVLPKPLLSSCPQA